MRCEEDTVDRNHTISRRQMLALSGAAASLAIVGNRDAAAQADAVRSVIASAEELGLRCVGEIPSPILGAEGNKEFFVMLS